MKEYNLEYIIDALTREGDRLFEKLNSEIPNELRYDFEAYEVISTSLISFRKEMDKLKGII